MDDAPAQEIDRQHLADALDREDELKLELEAAQEEVEQLKRLAIGHESKLQELNNLLEAEEAKTDAERTARQNAEATACRHRAETLEAKRKEKVANEHCEAAEMEILRLQREMKTERCTTATANRLIDQLREDLGLAEANRRGADEQLYAAKAKNYALDHDLATSNDRERILEDQAKDFEMTVLKQYQRVELAENALHTIAYKLEESNTKFCASMERYADLEAKHKQHILSPAAAATAAESDEPHANKQSLYSLYTQDHPPEQARRPPPSKLQQVHHTSKTTGESTHDKLTLRTVETQTKVAPRTPPCSSPAIYHPVSASVVVYQVEPPPKASGDFFNNRSWPIGKDPPWRLFYWLRPESLRLLCSALLGR